MTHRPEVEAWLRSYDNPMKPVVARLRDIILAADARMDECIKWQTPTFTFEGNLASFNPKSKQHASLLFHTGAQIPGRHPRLEGTGNTARTMKIGSLAEAEAAREELVAIVHAWCALKAGGQPAATSKRSAKKASKKATGSGKRPSKKATVKTAVKKGVARRSTGARQ